MIFKSRITEKWKASDYVKTILQFFVHAIIISMLFFAAVIINAGGFSAAKSIFEQSEKALRFIYVVFAVAFLLAMVYLYFYFEYKEFLKNGKNIFMVLLVLEISIVISFAVGKFSEYARPVSLCALLILLLVNRRSAIIMNVTYCMIMFMIDSFASVAAGGSISAGASQMLVNKEAYSVMIIGLATGILAIYLINEVSSRVKVFFRGIFISIPVIICTLCMEISNTEGILTSVLYGFTSGMLSVVLMMATLPFFESAFNVVTDYRLSEITDHKSKLIRRLRDKAPGTYNHSLTVSTLAESCAAAIGENPLLARAAAFYHDIGKLKQPEYFTENQRGYNPHNELSPELSTDIIRAHARDGYDLIRKYHLPQFLADVAREHHGTLPIKYFYLKAKKYTEGELDIADFSYAGPRPQSKIAAIIMICDGCEAAVRSLPDRSQKKVDEMVCAIIEERMNLGQFNDCDLTMKDIDVVKSTISQSLGGVYHDRIKYPEVKIAKTKSATVSDAELAEFGEKLEDDEKQ